MSKGKGKQKRAVENKCEKARGEKSQDRTEKAEKRKNKRRNVNRRMEKRREKKRMGKSERKGGEDTEVFRKT